MRANLIFREMREKRDYFAVVLDEYGCFVGIVTLHDLVETLVGDIDDRTDLPKPDDIEKTGEHVWKIQGGAILDDVAEAINVELPVEKYDTFSGFVCGVLERVPEDGEQFRCNWKNLDIVVEQVRNRKVLFMFSRRKKYRNRKKKSDKIFCFLWIFSIMLLLERVLFL